MPKAGFRLTLGQADAIAMYCRGNAHDSVVIRRTYGHKGRAYRLIDVETSRRRLRLDPEGNPVAINDDEVSQDYRRTPRPA